MIQEIVDKIQCGVHFLYENTGINQFGADKRYNNWIIKVQMLRTVFTSTIAYLGIFHGMICLFYKVYQIGEHLGGYNNFHVFLKWIDNRSWQLARNFCFDFILGGYILNQ